LPVPLPELPTLSLAATISPLHLLLTALAIAAAAFGALAAASLIGYSPTRLAQFLDDARRRDRAARTAELDTRDSEYLMVASLYLAAGWVLGLWSLAQGIDPANRGWAVALFVGAMLLIGGSVPVALAQVRPERTLLAVLPGLRPVWLVARWPIVLPLLTLTRAVLQLCGVRSGEPADPAEVQKQVVAAVADTVTGDALALEERTWIGNIVGMKDVTVTALMTPRADIVAFPDTLSLGDAVERALEHGFSRYPIYRDRLDEVVGILYVKDAMRPLHGVVQKSGTELAGTPLKSLLREPLFVPETTDAAQLLRRFQAGNQHMAIVIDEYGTTVGLVTVEDAIEAIVGDIGDEYDPPPTAVAADEQVRVVEAGRVLELPARTTVAEVNRLLGSDLPEEGDWETVAGLVIARLNHIPAVDETVAIDGVEFRVLQADERRIRRLRATLQTPQPAEGAG
jgi:CBS domain containing-hemolysin-like protein